MTARINRSGLVMAAVLAVASAGPASAMSGADEGGGSTVTRWTGSVPDEWKSGPAASAAAAPQPDAMQASAVEKPAEMAAPAPAAAAEEKPAAQMAAAPEAPEPAAAPAAEKSTGSSMAAITAKGVDPEWIRQQNAASEALRQEQLSRAGDSAPAESE